MAVEQDLREDPDEEFEVHGTLAARARRPLGRRAPPPPRMRAYFFIAGAAIARRFASLFSLHFSPGCRSSRA